MEDLTMTNYIIYQSIEAANAIMLAMDMLPPSMINLRGVHYISNAAATANLELAYILCGMPEPS